MNIKEYITFPDFISLLNASFGFLAIMMVLEGDLNLASMFILIAVIFDCLDGWVARKSNRVDHFGFGKNVDSLCDVISFGVAPGMLLYAASTSYFIPYLNILVSLLIVLSGILRLSRFNVLTDSGANLGEGKFIGLPIPTTALILGSFYLSGIFNEELALIIMTAVSILMISTVEYTKIRNPLLLLVGGLLVILSCLPQNISSVIANLPAKFLFIFALIYLVTVPFIVLYGKHHRSGPNVR